MPLLLIQNNDYESFGGEDTKPRDIAIFFCTGIMIFSLAFPVLLAKTPVDKPSIPVYTCVLTELASILLYATTAIFFVTSLNDDENEF